MLVKKIENLISDLKEICGLPKINISLGCYKTKDDEFYKKVVSDFYYEATSRHSKLLIVPQMKYGVALSDLAEDFDTFFMKIAPAARRNYKKSSRLKYIFRKINASEYTDEIYAIRTSTKVRQGRLPDKILKKKVSANENPVPLYKGYGYPYYGVFSEDGVLVAYAGILVTGEIAIMESIYGHAKYQSDGVVPFLIINLAKEWIESDEYGNVKYFSYGTYYGASETMRRFKKKMDFKPHNVNWCLD